MPRVLQLAFVFVMILVLKSNEWSLDIICDDFIQDALLGLEYFHSSLRKMDTMAKELLVVWYVGVDERRLIEAVLFKKGFGFAIIVHFFVVWKLFLEVLESEVSGNLFHFLLLE